MSDRSWFSGTQGRDHHEPSPENFSGPPRHEYHHQDFGNKNGGENWGDRGHQNCENHHRHDGGDQFPVHSDGGGGASDASMGQPQAHHAGAELGWGPAAWGEAGGFDAVLIGHMIGGVPIPQFLEINNLEINNNSFVQNTLVDNTSILFNTGNDGTIDVGGDVNALSSQLLDSQFHTLTTASHSGGELGLGDMASSGLGGVEASLFGQVGGGTAAAGGGSIFVIPIDHLEINNNTFIQNTLVDNTQVAFNTSNGGTIDVGGNVNALGSQQVLPDHSTAPPEIQHFA
jgi:hypothetical protein